MASHSVNEEGGEEYMCENHKQGAAEYLSSMFNKPDFSDHVFLIEGKELFCHKAILSSKSEYFKTMFQCELTPKDRSDITTSTYDTFYSIIRFIYTGKITLSEDNMELILRDAEMMQLDNLKEIVGKHFLKILHTENCFQIFDMADTYQVAPLKEKVCKYILERFEALVDTAGFQNLSETLLKFFIGHQDLSIPAEEVCCQAIVKWFKKDKQNRKTSLIPLFSKLRLENINPGYIYHTLLEQNSPLQESAEVITFLKTVNDSNVFGSQMPLGYTPGHPRTQTNCLQTVGLMWLDRDILHIESQFLDSHSRYKPDKVKISLPRLFGRNVPRYRYIRNVTTLENKYCVVHLADFKEWSKMQEMFLFLIKLDTPDYSVQRIHWSGEANVFVFPLVYQKKRLLCLSFITLKEPFLLQLEALKEYQFEHNQWVTLKFFDSYYLVKPFRGFSAVIHMHHLYLFGVDALESGNYRGVLCMDLKSKRTAILESFFSKEYAMLQAQVYTNYVVILAIVGLETECIFVSLFDLEKKFEALLLPNVSNAAENLGKDLVHYVPISQGVINSKRDFEMLVLGNQLIVARVPNSLNKARIYSANLDHYIQNHDSLKLNCWKFSRKDFINSIALIPLRVSRFSLSSRDVGERRLSGASYRFRSRSRSCSFETYVGRSIARSRSRSLVRERSFSRSSERSYTRSRERSVTRERSYSRSRERSWSRSPSYCDSEFS